MILGEQPLPQVDTAAFPGATPDTLLTLKPHLEGVEARTTKKLSLMKLRHSLEPSEAHMP